MSYGSDTLDYYRQVWALHRSNSQRCKARRLAGLAVDQIRVGHQLQTARALGLEVPNSLQLLADEVIE